MTHADDSQKQLANPSSNMQNEEDIVINVDLPFFLSSLLRQWWIILICTIIGCVIGYLYYNSQDKIYRVTMQIKPGITSLTDTGESRGYTASDIYTWIKTGQYIKMADDLGMDKGSIPEFDVDMNYKGDLLIVSLESANPAADEELMMDIITSWNKIDNSTVLAYGNLQIQSIISDKKKKIEALKSMITEHDRQVAHYQSMVNSYYEENKALSRKIDSVRIEQKKAYALYEGIARDALLAPSKQKGTKSDNEPSEDYKRSQALYLLGVMGDKAASFNAELERLYEKQRGNERVISEYNNKLEKLDYSGSEEPLKEIQMLENDIHFIQERSRFINPIQVLASPVTERYPVWPKKKLILVVSALLGFSLGCIIALIRMRFRAAPA